MTMKSINPATGQVLKTFETLNSAEIQEKLARAQEAFLQYRRTEFSERTYWMNNAAQILETQTDRFARLMTQEMGKPIKSALAEAKKCAWVCRYYAENAEKFLSDEVVETNASLSYIRYQPIGPVLAIMPWNFPFWQVFRFAAPALMAGNVGLLKHASNVPQCALAIEAIFQEAGFPKDVFQALLIGSDQVAQVLEDGRVAAATLTGSEPAGSSVAGQAGKLIKKTVLELGGSDPFIVMPSADMQEAIRTAVKARNINNGQSCIAAKRFIIHEAVYEPFTQGFIEGMRALKLGNPMDERIDIGPLATEGILQGLDDQVRESIEKGARALLGGEPLERSGNYFPPTVLVNIPQDSPAYREELFGPVASLFKVADIDEALRVANDTKFGLGSSAWTNDEGEQQRFINELQAGNVFINGMVASDPRLPFGGVKRSGYGRELSDHGIREFVNIKTVWIREGSVENSSDTE
jgi:succinate-semialdehyde dehydrogenase/glutarate-semialdehyde dehydrogenase